MQALTFKSDQLLVRFTNICVKSFLDLITVGKLRMRIMSDSSILFFLFVVDILSLLQGRIFSVALT